MKGSDTLMLVARGECGWEAVRDEGVEVVFDASGCSTEIPANIVEYDPTAGELAMGFLAAGARGDLSKWATVILCGPFGFDRFSDTDDGERLKEILWDVSFGWQPSDHDLAFVARLARPAQ